MRSTVLVALLGAPFLLPFITSLRGPHKMYSQPPDIAEVAALFPAAVAIMDIDNDGILDCLSATRTQYDPEGGTATYIWTLSGENGERISVPLYTSWTNEPGTFNITVETKPGQVFIATVHYFDRKTCMVLETPHFGDQCTLWVLQEYEDELPRNCLRHFGGICGNGVSVRDKDLCEDATK